jgi:hypothetical protein
MHRMDVVQTLGRLVCPCPPVSARSHSSLSHVEKDSIAVHTCVGHINVYVDTVHAILSNIFKILTTTSNCKASGNSSPDNAMRNI